MKNPAPTLATSRDPETAHLKIQIGSEAYEAGRSYRISEEIIVGASGLVFKFECTKDFTLTMQSIEGDAGSIRLRAYRSTQGTEGGLFNQSIAIYSRNFKSTTPVVPTSSTISTGGTFTPAALPAGKAVETIRLKTSDQSNKQTTAGGAIGEQRGLPSGTYYLAFDRFSGNTDGEGVFALTWEEDA